MKAPTHLKINRQGILALSKETGIRGLSDMGLYLILLDLAECSGTPGVVVSLHQLAPLLGICRNSLARSLRRMEAAGAILTAPSGQDGLAIGFRLQT